MTDPMEAAAPPARISINAADLAAADAGYASFPDFEKWSALGITAELWDDAIARLNAVRASINEDAIKRAVTTTMRLAAIDTGAVEGLYDVDRGFTFSVAEQAAAWEVEMQNRGAHVRPLFESQLRAYEVVLDAATASIPVTEAFIRRIHEEVTGAQETYTVQTSLGLQTRTLPRGQYKEFPNHPWGADGLRHSYAPVADTAPEMHRLVVAINSMPFQAAHPILQASWVHYVMAQIHPFADGNGRTCRAVASIYLYRGASIPFLIFADQKPGYLDALAAADRGDFQAFADYLGDRAISTVNRFTEILRAASAPALDQSLAALRNLHVAVGTLSYAELDSLVSRINQVVTDESLKQIQEFDLPSSIRTEVTGVSAIERTDSAYRPAIAAENIGTRVNFTSIAPADAGVAKDILIQIARDRNPGRTFEVSVGGRDPIHLALADVYPEITRDATDRIGTLVRMILAVAMDELRRNAEANLRSKGF